MSKQQVVIGVVAGFAAGALVGVLFAPDKGSETRKKIAKKSSDTFGDLKNKLASLMDDFNEKVEEEKEAVSAAFGHTNHKSKEDKKEAKTV